MLAFHINKFGAEKPNKIHVLKTLVGFGRTNVQTNTETFAAGNQRYAIQKFCGLFLTLEEFFQLDFILCYRCAVRFQQNLTFDCVQNDHISIFHDFSCFRHTKHCWDLIALGKDSGVRGGSTNFCDNAHHMRPVERGCVTWKQVVRHNHHFFPQISQVLFFFTFQDA